MRKASRQRELTASEGSDTLTDARKQADPFWCALPTSAGLDLIESERIGVQLPRNRLLGKEPLPPALFQTKEYPFHSLLA